MAKTLESKLRFTFVTVGDKAAVRANKTISKSAKDLSKDSRELSNAYKAQEKALKSLNAKLEKATEELKRLNVAYKKASDGQRRFSKDTDLTYRNNRNLLGTFSVLRSKVLLATFAIVSLQKTLGKFIQQSSDAEETLNKLKVVFGENANNALKFAKDLGIAAGRSQYELREMLSTVQDTFVPLGFARDISASLSKAVVKLAVDVASFQNKSDKEVIKSFTSALVGNHEAVRSYGITLTEATLKTAALIHGIIDEARELTAKEKALARLIVIQKQSSDSNNDAIETIESLTNQTKAMNAAFQESAVVIGKELEPVALKFVKVMKALAEAFSDTGRIRAYALAIAGLAAKMIFAEASAYKLGRALGTVWYKGGKQLLKFIAIAETLTFILNKMMDRDFSEYEIDIGTESIDSLVEKMKSSEIDYTKFTTEQLNQRLSAHQGELDSLIEYTKEYHSQCKRYSDEELQNLLDNHQSAIQAIKSALGDRETLQKELTDAINKQTLLTYEYDLLKIEEKKKLYEKAKLDQNDIDKWYDAELERLDNEDIKRQNKFDKKRDAKAKQLAKKQLALQESTNLEISKLTKSQLDYELDVLKTKYEKDLELAKDNAELIKDIEDSYRLQKDALEEAHRKRTIQKNIDMANQLIGSFSSVSSAYSQMVQGQLNEDIDKLKSSAEYEQATMEQREILEQKIKDKHRGAAKRAANIEKAGSIANATMNAFEAYNNALATVPIPFNVMAAKIMFGLGMAQVAAIAATPTGYAKGGEFITNKPEMIMVGEAGREHVKVTPIDRPESRALKDGQTVNINISAPLVDETVVDSIIPAIQRAERMNLA